MLAANEAVARQLEERSIGFLYRIHERARRARHRRSRAAPLGASASACRTTAPTSRRRHLQAVIERSRGQAGRARSSTCWCCARCSRRATAPSRRSISGSRASATRISPRPFAAIRICSRTVRCALARERPQSRCRPASHARADRRARLAAASAARWRPSATSRAPPACCSCSTTSARSSTARRARRSQRLRGRARRCISSKDLCRSDDCRNITSS